MDLIAETERKIEALKLRLCELEGKANKNQRSSVNKAIYSLENDVEYVAAVKARVEQERAQTAAADDAAHASKLEREQAAQPMSSNAKFSGDLSEGHSRQQVEQLFDEVILALEDGAWRMRISSCNAALCVAGPSQTHCSTRLHSTRPNTRNGRIADGAATDNDSEAAPRKAYWKM